MAKRQGNVYLGYEDEIITEKSKTLINHTVNKIGGFPDFPPLENLQFISKCPLCGLYRLLIVQCYAPLENSFHRTLYVFACVSPNCWSQSESWSCVRSQIQDGSSTIEDICNTVAMPTESNLAWCNAADEWDINDNGDMANGNVLSVDNAASANNPNQRLSDEDEESNSYEMDSVEQALGNLQVFDAHNANMSPVQGAVGAVGTTVAAAELEEGDEPGLVSVDTPTGPDNDLQELLNQTAEMPVDLRNHLILGPVQFTPKYIYVEEEFKKPAKNDDDRVTELLNKYKKENELELSAGAEEGGAGGGGAGGAAEEEYEEAAPLHGDTLFHAFLTRLKCNPGQVLRYSRTESPILGAPLPDAGILRATCSRCGSALICELQLLPALANALNLPRDLRVQHLQLLSVLIFTCSRSCWQPTDVLVEECVVFQPEI